jgi:hypothetical protein
MTSGSYRSILKFCSGQIEVSGMIEFLTMLSRGISGNIEYQSCWVFHNISRGCLNLRFRFRMEELRIFEVSGQKPGRIEQTPRIEIELQVLTRGLYMRRAKFSSNFYRDA